MGILMLLNSKMGFAAIGAVLLLLMFGYYNVKIGAINALHSIEVSKLTQEAETQKTLAIVNDQRNKVCQSDYAVTIGKLKEQNEKINNMEAEGKKKIAKAVADALSKIRPPGRIEVILNEPAGPVTMNTFLAQEFGRGIL